jgi:hypothetical protein
VLAPADDATERVWFVDTAHGRVVATVARTTGQVTGPDDPAPVWAGTDVGRTLERIE